MKTLLPFIHWFGFETDIDDPSDIHFYQTIILAPSGVDALDWGDKLADHLIQKGEVKQIHSSWIEKIIPTLIEKEKIISINWEKVSCQELETYYQGTASHKKDPSDKNINAFISSTNEKDAKAVWTNYLLNNYPEYKIETCCRPSISITKVGQHVDWL